ncbi:hypothetical protein ONZ45_g16705 [Pleurotus djamor]|nr:hypothetical protein ONZ45_g16705 [Pleurotus djamor]
MRPLWSDLALGGFHRNLTVNAPGFLLAYKLSAISRIVFDVFITFALTTTLYRSRSGVKKSDHVIKLLILFTVNTNLLTTLLSIFELVTFLAYPRATIYGGIGFLSPKTYFNTLLSAMNSREYMKSELNNSGAPTVSNSGTDVDFWRGKSLRDRFHFGSSFSTKESHPTSEVRFVFFKKVKP